MFQKHDFNTSMNNHPKCMSQTVKLFQVLQAITSTSASLTDYDK